MSKSGKSTLISLFFLTTLTFTLFHGVLNHEFIVTDDPVYVTKNRHVLQGITLETLKWAFTTSYANFWHPLTWLSHQLDAHFYGLNPMGHHLTSLILHILTAALLFLSLNLMTGAMGKSLFVAFLFAVHPLHVESVAWVSERKDVLSTFFWMLTMLAYAHYAHSPSLKRYIMVFFSFTAGLMAKPMLVTLPFVLILLDYWPLKRFQSQRLKTLCLEKAPLFLLTVLFSVIAFLAQSRGGALPSVDMVPTKYRLTNALVSYFKYFNKTLIPEELSVFYPHPLDYLSLWEIAGAAVFLAFLTISALFLIKKKPCISVGWLWYTGTLVPVIGLVQVGSHAMADRYTYVPLIGLFIVIVWVITDIFNKTVLGKRVVTLIGCLWLAALMTLSYKQIGYWQNSITLYEHALKVTKKNHVAHYSLGLALSAQGDLDKALSHYSTAIRLSYEYDDAYNNLGLTLYRMGRIDEAAEVFIELLKMAPDHVKGNINFGTVLKSMGKMDEAAILFEKAIQLKPDIAEGHSNLASVLIERGEMDRAISHLREALRLKPDFYVMNNLGFALHKKGMKEKAMEMYRNALLLNPNYGKANYNIAVLLNGTGKYKEAIQHLHKALEEESDKSNIYYQLGNVYSNMGETDKALNHYDQAIAYNPDQFEALNNKGVVLAKLGRLKEAKEYFDKALEINPNYGQAKANLDGALKILQVTP